MTSHEIQKADLLDIIFDGRNKQYGAYALRRQYHQRLGISVGIALSLGLLLFFVKPEWKQVSRALEAKPDVILRVLEVPPPPAQAPPPPPRGRVTPPPPTASAALTDKINMMQNPDPEKEMADMKTLATSAVGNTNKEGPETTGVVQSKETEAPGGDGGKGKESGAEEGSFVSVEQQPEFPGGMQAWMAFLNRHLQTPDDLEPGEKKAVLVSFVVDKDGTVTGFRVVQSGGRRFDEEVIRVLRKMPKWKPAIQNGHPVALSYTQPVTFVGVEQ
jgi:protein TonB